jgi:hypothetical protein
MYCTKHQMNPSISQKFFPNESLENFSKKSLSKNILNEPLENK